MKTSLLALCFLLFAYSNADLIYDDDNDPVVNAARQYYLVPVSEPNDGVEKNLTNVFPVIFAAAERPLLIESSFLVGISFVFTSDETGGWIVDKELPIGWTVKVGEDDIWDGPFRVHPAKNGYKIVYHHDKDDDVGIVCSGGYRRLVVKDGEPFIFKIKKANENYARITSVV